MKDFLLKLLNDPEKFNKFVKLSTEEEIYEFCVQNGAEFSIEEFKDVIKQSMNKFKKEIKLEEVKDLDSVVGGKKEGKSFNNFLALAMAALSIGGTFTPAINATEVRKVSNKKTKQVVLKNSDSEFGTLAKWALAGLGLSAVPLALMYYLSKSNEDSLNTEGQMKNNSFIEFKTSNGSKLSTDMNKKGVLKKPSAESNTSIFKEENNNLVPPFSGIANYNENGGCLNRCYINAYVQVLYEIPEFRQLVKDKSENGSNEMFWRLNNVFKKMDKREPIKYDDEDYMKFCELVGHKGTQRSYDDVNENIDRIFPGLRLNAFPQEIFFTNPDFNTVNNIRDFIAAEDNKSLMVMIGRGADTEEVMDCPVDIPETLRNQSGKTLKLTCIMLHLGVYITSGHCTTVKRDEQGNWWYCDDGKVEEADSKYLPNGDYTKKNAVYLYYRADD